MRIKIELPDGSLHNNVSELRAYQRQKIENAIGTLIVDPAMRQHLLSSAKVRTQLMDMIVESLPQLVALHSQLITDRDISEFVGNLRETADCLMPD
jgi:hypothetical protein